LRLITQIKETLYLETCAVGCEDYCGGRCNQGYWNLCVCYGNFATVVTDITTAFLFTMVTLFDIVTDILVVTSAKVLTGVTSG
jgi:hypothetical protein